MEDDGGSYINQSKRGRFPNKASLILFSYASIKATERFNALFSIGVSANTTDVRVTICVRQEKNLVQHNSVVDVG